MFLTGKWARLIAEGYGQALALTAVGDGAGGGGGGGGVAGGSFSQEQSDYLDQRIAATVTGILKRSADRQKDAILGEVGSLLDKKFAEFKPKVDVGGEGASAGGGKGGKGKDDQIGLTTLQQRLQSMEAELQASRKERDAERARNRDMTLRSTMADNLARIGIKDPIDQKHAIAVLREAGVVRYEADDSDRVVWANQDGTAYEAELGFRQWAKSEEAKRFLPATGTRGSGSGRGAGPLQQGNGGANGGDPKAVEGALWAALGDEL